MYNGINLHDENVSTSTKWDEQMLRMLERRYFDMRWWSHRIQHHCQFILTFCIHQVKIGIEYSSNVWNRIWCTRSIVFTFWIWTRIVTIWMPFAVLFVMIRIVGIAPSVAHVGGCRVWGATSISGHRWCCSIVIRFRLIAKSWHTLGISSTVCDASAAAATTTATTRPVAIWIVTLIIRWIRINGIDFVIIVVFVMEMRWIWIIEVIWFTASHIDRWVCLRFHFICGQIRICTSICSCRRWESIHCGHYCRGAWHFCAIDCIWIQICRWYRATAWECRWIILSALIFRWRWVRFLRHCWVRTYRIHWRWRYVICCRWICCCLSRWWTICFNWTGHHCIDIGCTGHIGLNCYHRRRHSFNNNNNKTHMKIITNGFLLKIETFNKFKIRNIPSSFGGISLLSRMPQFSLRWYKL